MANNWKIEWKDFNEVLTTAYIYRDITSSTFDALVPAADPFAINTTWDNDYLQPLRVQTGNLNVIYTADTASLFNGLFATTSTQLYVKIMQNSQLVWQGYMEPQQFSRDAFRYGETVILPVTDLLGAMGSKDIDSSLGFGTTTIASLIIEAMECLGNKLDKLVFPCEWTSDSSTTDFYAWMKIQVSRKNLITENDDENEEDPDWKKYDCKSHQAVVESIAKMFGWAAYINKTTLVFASPKKSVLKTATMTKANLSTLAAGGTPTMTVTNDSDPVNINTFTYAGVDNQIENIAGSKRVKITASSNPVTDLGIGISTEGLVFDRKVDANASVSDKFHGLVFTSKQNSKMTLTSYRFNRISETYAELESVGYDSHTDDIPTQSGGYLSTQVEKGDYFEASAIANKVNYSYSDMLVIKNSIPQEPGSDVDVAWESNVVAKFSGVYMPPTNTGCIDLSMQIGGGSTGSTNNNVRFVFRVGDKYWNGNGWQTSRTTFTTQTIGGAIKVTKTLAMEYEGAANYVMPINETLSGIVELELIPGEGMVSNSNGWLIIKSLSAKYCNDETESYKSTKESATYSIEGSKELSDKKDIELIWCTKTGNVKNGFGVMRWNGSYLTASDLKYNGSSTIDPESALLVKAKSAYLNGAIVLSINILKGSSDLPAIGSRLSYDSVFYTVAAIDYNWKTCEAIIRTIRTA